MVPLPMKLAWCSSVSSASGVIWLNDLVNVVYEINIGISVTWCQNQCQWCHMTKKLWTTLFWLSWPRNCICAIDSAVGIISCWCQCQWCHMAKSHFGPNCNLIVLINAISCKLTMPLAPHYTNTGASVSHDQKDNVASHFDCLNLMYIWM